MIRRFTRFMALIVILTLASADAWASAAAAVLHGSGGVSVNGDGVTPTTTVFIGDRIDTAPNSAANLTMNGSSVLVGQNSSLVYSGQIVNFTSGGATVKTEQKMGAKFQRVRITPSQSAAKYQLQQKGNILTVAAIEGNLSIENGLNNFGLVSGKTVDINLDPKEREKVALDEPGSPSTTTQADGTPYPVDNGNATGTYIAGGTAVVVGVAIIGLLAVNNKPVSPKGP